MMSLPKSDSTMDSVETALKAVYSDPHSPKLPGKRSLLQKIWAFFKSTLKWGALFILLMQVWFFTHLLWWKYWSPSSTAFMRERVEENPELAIDYQWVPYHRISPALKQALIASEDAHFMTHHGFDWEGIKMAYAKNLKRGRITAGGSTITQQLAKNLFLNSDKNFLRKGQEAIITVMIESLWSKSRILEVYANVIEWGNGIFGAEAAAQYYFGVSAEELSTRQASQLAAMVPSPRYYQKRMESSRYLRRRSSTIRARLSDAQAPH